MPKHEAKLHQGRETESYSVLNEVPSKMRNLMRNMANDSLSFDYSNYENDLLRCVLLVPYEEFHLQKESKYPCKHDNHKSQYSNVVNQHESIK